MHKHWIAAGSLLVVVIVFVCGCSTPTPDPPTHAGVSVSPRVTTAGTSGGLTLHVASLASDATLPDIYSCRGTAESPAISWDGIPDGTKSLVLILDDPDAPAGPFTHWIVYNIPPTVGGLAPAQPNAKVLASGAQQGETTAGSRGYYPPCPPIGTTHRYVFRLYAVDMDITQPTADRNSIDWALNGHTLTKAEFTTTFRR